MAVHRAFRGVQKAAPAGGMRIVIYDLGVGISPSGSQLVAAPELLLGLHVGAPPDLFNPRGQDWGLTALSPRD